MSVARPTLEQMVDLVESLGMTMTRERVAEFLSLMEGNFVAYEPSRPDTRLYTDGQISTHSGLSTFPPL